MKVRELCIAHPDGSYEPKQQITIKTPTATITLNPGTKIQPNAEFSGIPFAQILDMEVG